MTALGDRVAMARRSKAFSDVAWERVRQDDKWGEQNHPDLGAFPPSWPGRPPHFGVEETRAHFGALERHWQRVNAQRVASGDVAWDGVLLEEVFEALSAVTVAGRREELVQVAATALAWIEAIDRRTAAAAAAAEALDRVEEPEAPAGSRDLMADLRASLDAAIDRRGRRS